MQATFLLRDIAVAGLVFLGSAAMALAQTGVPDEPAITPPAQSPQTRPTSQEIAALIDKLGSDDPQVHADARQALIRAGGAAELALRKVAGGSNADAARAASEILADLNFAIRPDMPPKVVELLKEYGSADEKGRLDIVQKLKLIGPSAFHGLARIWLTDHSTMLQNDAAIGYWASELIADDDEGSVPDLMHQAAYSGKPIAVRSAAAYFLSAGTLDAEMASALKRVDDANDKAAGTFLIYANRARGDLEAAGKYATDYADGLTQTELAEERGDWAGAAANLLNAGNVWNSQVAYFGRLAAYYRLAGDEEQYKKATDATIASQGATSQKLKAYFLNDRPREGLEAIKSLDRGLYVAMLCNQSRYQQAVDEADRDGRFDSKRRVVGPLSDFGARYSARYLLEELHKDAFSHNELDPRMSAVVELRRFGMADRAREDIDKILGMYGEGNALNHLYELLPGTSRDLISWWEICREQKPRVPASELVADLEQLFSGTLPNANEYCDKAVQFAARRPYADNNQLFGDIVHIASKAGWNEALERYVNGAKGPYPFRVLGDELAAKGQWARAAAAYGRAWDAGHWQMDGTLNLALQANALMKSGHVEEGRALLERAERALLAGDEARDRFVIGLRAAGLEAEADRQQKLACQVCAFGDAAILSYSEARAVALEKTDPMTSAMLWERTLLYNTRQSASFYNPLSFQNLPHKVHQLRARGFERTGDVERALRELKLAIACLPLDADSVSAAVRMLDKADRRKEADAIYDPVFSELVTLANEFTESATAHNNLAWLAACSRRDPDVALNQAKLAVKLEPTNAGYFDTLAEAYLASGDKAKALEMERNALELAPSPSLLDGRLQEIERAR